MSTDERMEKMEGQLTRIRWFNRCLIACIVLSLGVWFILKTFGPETAWAQSGEKVIRATKFVLEDENGKTRAILGMVKDRPMLRLLDENYKAAVPLAAVKEGPVLLLYDEDEKPRAVMSVSKDGPGLALYDEKGNQCASLAESKDATMLVLSNEKDVTMLVLSNEKHKPGIILSVHKDGSGVRLYDENDRTRALLGTGQAMTPDGKVISYPKSSLILFGADGNEIWSAP